MEINIDEQLLLSRRVDKNSKQTIVSQVLRIAIYDEFKAYESYTAIIERFGFIQPFVNIKEAEARHYMALIPLLEKYKVEVPINNWASKIEVPNSYVEACELGVASEIENITMYDNLISYTTQQDIKNVLYRLQAASFNNHLPSFRRAILNHYTSKNNFQFEFNQEQIMQNIEEYQELFQEIIKGNVDQDKLTQIFSKLNLSMISGAVFGGAVIAFLNSYVENKDNKE